MKTKPTVITCRTGNELCPPAAVADWAQKETFSPPEIFFCFFFWNVRGPCEDFWSYNSAKMNWRLKRKKKKEPQPMFHWRLLPGVHFPPWTHANNTRHWGANSKSTYSTNMAAGNLGQGALIFNDMNTSPVLKTAKRCHSTHSKIQQSGNTARWEPHSTRMTADRPGESVNCSYTPLLFVFLLHSPVQQEEEEEEETMREAKEPAIKAFWPELF